MSKFSNSFSEETWYQKYKAPNDETVEDTWRRVAKNLASVEEDKEKWEQEFYTILEDFRFIPGGRILSNAGLGIKGVSMINCFVSNANGTDIDSIEGIYEELTRQAKILKSEGGYGFCADFMRPKGSHIGGIANQSPGAVKFLELWDKSSEIITAGSGKKSRKDQKNFIRKGAQLVSMSCWHPDIIEFITAKTEPGRLSKFNMSVLCTDEFMIAVAMDMPWKLEFPNYEAFPSWYKNQWNGNLKSWKETCQYSSESNQPSTIVYYEFESARELWDLLMQNTYNRGEPGVLFIDTINRMNNLYYEEYISATNPCAEQALPTYGSCLLGSINLVHFIDPKTQNWKYDELRPVIHTAVRLMDNVNDITYVPLKEQKQQLQDKRRVGLGIMGYGSALLMARIRYSSKKALELTNKLMHFIANEAYKASTYLAKEKGAFKLYDQDKYLAGAFVKRLDPSTKTLIKRYGIRNSHLTSIQPTGNSACFANLVSGGLEPLFMHGYVRTSIQPTAPDGLPVPKNINWKEKTFDLERIADNEVHWEWATEGDEGLLITKFNDKVWKYDRTRGLVKEEWVEDYGVSYLKDKKQWNSEADWAACAMDLTVEDHVNTLATFATWLCSSASKTVNVAHDYPYEDFKTIYQTAWREGIKGITTYRAGTMTTVLSKNSSYDDNKITKTVAPERPRELPCDVHHIRVKGDEYFVLVGLYKDDPYEVFAGKNGFVDKKTTAGTITRLKRPKGVYKAILEDGLELSPINATCSEEEDALTRLSSTALRHGADIHMVVQQLEKVKGDMTCFAKSMARALKKYIPDGTKEGSSCPECDSQNLVRLEGCLRCQDCNWSRCS